MALCCFDFLKKKIYLIRNLAQENFRNKTYRNSSGFVPKVGAILKAKWRHVSLLLNREPQAQCRAVPCIIHDLMEWIKCVAIHVRPCRHSQVHQQGTDFSSSTFCWPRLFPPHISETNCGSILIITSHPNISPRTCKLIGVMRVLATGRVKHCRFTVSMH